MQSNKIASISVLVIGVGLLVASLLADVIGIGEILTVRCSAANWYDCGSGCNRYRFVPHA